MIFVCLSQVFSFFPRSNALNSVFYRFERLMIFEKIRQMFEHCQGLRVDEAGVTSSAFQRVARKMRCQASAADLVFVKICAEVSSSSSHLGFHMFISALCALSTDGGDSSFAERHECESKAEILQAIVDVYFDDDDDDDDDNE